MYGDRKMLAISVHAESLCRHPESISMPTASAVRCCIKRGFQNVDPDWLPEARKRKYNWDRKSQVLVKKL